MKKSLLVILLSVIALVATSQEYQYVPFPDSNAVWSEIYLKPWDEPTPRWVYNKYALFNEDTLINGIIYNKLFRTHATEITRENSEYIAGLREDSTKKVFIKYADSFVPDEPYYKKEFMLYNFGIDVGDTLWSWQIEIFPLSYIVVKKIDTLQVNNSLRKIISFVRPGWVYWIEGIGNVKGLFFAFGDLPTNGMDNDLVCMH